jgi:hypothetical protein
MHFSISVAKQRFIDELSQVAGAKCTYVRLSKKDNRGSAIQRLARRSGVRLLGLSFWEASQVSKSAFA